jgi:hypothetical protein
LTTTPDTGYFLKFKLSGRISSATNKNKMLIAEEYWQVKQGAALAIPTNTIVNQISAKDTEISTATYVADLTADTLKIKINGIGTIDVINWRIVVDLVGY